MSPSQRKQASPGGSPEKRKLRPCIDSLSIPMHIVKLKTDGLFMSSIRHSHGLPISNQPSACICQDEECPKDMSNVTTALKPKVETFPCGTTNGFRDPNRPTQKKLKTRYAQSDFPENTDQDCDCDDGKQRSLRFAASTPCKAPYLNNYFRNPIIPEEPCPEECPPCDESALNQNFKQSNTQHQSFPDKYRSRRNYPGLQNFRPSSLEEEPCPAKSPFYDGTTIKPNWPSNAQHQTCPDNYRSRRIAPGNQHFRTPSAQHEPSGEYPSYDSSPGNQNFWTPQPECCLDKIPSPEGPSKNKNCKSLGVQHDSRDKRPDQLSNSTSCEKWPKYLAELLEEKLRSDSTLLNDSRSIERRNYPDTTQTSPTCSLDYINRNPRNIERRTVELIDRSTSTPGCRTTESYTEPHVNFKQNNDTREFQQHFSNNDRGQNSKFVDGSASPVTVISTKPSKERPELKTNENMSRVRSPCPSTSAPNSQNQLDEIRGKKLNQSFGQPLAKSGDDALTDKTQDTLSCPCQYPPGFNDIACSGRITGLCNCGKN